MSFHAGRAAGHDGNHAVFDPGITDVFLIDQKHAAHGLEQNLGGGLLLRFDHAHQGFDFLRGQSVGFLFGSRFLDGLGHALLVEGLQQVVDGVDLERLHRILVEGGGEDNFRQRNFLVEQLLDDSEAVEPGHLHVEKNQIRIVFLDQVEGFQSVFALSHDSYIAGILQEVSKFVAGELLVVHDYCG